MLVWNKSRAIFSWTAGFFKVFSQVVVHSAEIKKNLPLPHSCLMFYELAYMYFYWRDSCKKELLKRRWVGGGWENISFHLILIVSVGPDFAELSIAINELLPSRNPATMRDSVPRSSTNIFYLQLHHSFLDSSSPFSNSMTTFSFYV